MKSTKVRLAERPGSSTTEGGAARYNAVRLNQKGSPMLLRVLAALVMMVTVPVARPASEVNVRDTRLLHQPATNGSHVAFVYADDLWVARIEGTELRRLTTDDGIESRPAFSPDGNL